MSRVRQLRLHLKEFTMTCSIIGSGSGSGSVATAFARQLARSGIAVGIANPRCPDAIETMAKQLGAQVTAMTSHDGLGTDVIILAVPLRAQTDVGDEISGSIGTIVSDAMSADDISPDEFMGILNAAR
jgi:predicted dinucleotide-binding enzyme